MSRILCFMTTLRSSCWLSCWPMVFADYETAEGTTHYDFWQFPLEYCYLSNIRSNSTLGLQYIYILIFYFFCLIFDYFPIRSLFISLNESYWLWFFLKIIDFLKYYLNVVYYTIHIYYLMMSCFIFDIYFYVFIL